MKDMLGALSNTQRFILTLAGLGLIAGLEGLALYLGHNGIMLTSTVGAIVGIIGLAYGVKIGKGKQNPS